VGASRILTQERGTEYKFLKVKLAEEARYETWTGGEIHQKTNQQSCITVKRGQKSVKSGGGDGCVSIKFCESEDAGKETRTLFACQKEKEKEQRQKGGGFGKVEARIDAIGTRRFEYRRTNKPIKQKH